jgi:hypothetical protein
MDRCFPPSSGPFSFVPPYTFRDGSLEVPEVIGQFGLCLHVAKCRQGYLQWQQACSFPFHVKFFRDAPQPRATIKRYTLASPCFLMSS